MILNHRTMMTLLLEGNNKGESDNVKRDVNDNDNKRDVTNESDQDDKK